MRGEAEGPRVTASLSVDGQVGSRVHTPQRSCGGYTSAACTCEPRTRCRCALKVPDSAFLTGLLFSLFVLQMDPFSGAVLPGSGKQTRMGVGGVAESVIGIQKLAHPRDLSCSFLSRVRQKHSYVFYFSLLHKKGGDSPVS